MFRPIEWWGASRARRRGKPETSLTRRKGVVKVHLISARRRSRGFGLQHYLFDKDDSLEKLTH